MQVHITAAIGDATRLHFHFVQTDDSLFDHIAKELVQLTNSLLCVEI
jgi:hypothetical protein